ncbi:MAG: ABC transporter ATP-binding protein [Planctomycetota bacterium]
MPLLRVHHLTAGYETQAPVLHDVALTLESGQMLALCGPNGSGKSTLLRCLTGLLKPQSGRVTLEHDNERPQRVHKIPRRRLARTLAFLPQSPIAPPGVTVRQLVAYGRNPHTLPIPFATRHLTTDRDIVEQAIRRCDLQKLADRDVATLSGGERQRAWLAMAVAQDARILLLDEPVSALDVAHQLEVLDLLVDLNEERKTTVVIVLHDIQLAARYFRQPHHRLAALRAGRLLAVGPMIDLLTPELLEQTFGVSARVHTFAELPYPVCAFR